MSEIQNSNKTQAGRRVVETSSWRLTIPATTNDASPLLVVPTVHPRGDRRIVRCAQVAANAGFRVHFLWLGEGSDASLDPAASETLLPPPRNAAERIGRVGLTSRLASEIDAEMWHIHDYYFLSHAKRWRKKTGKPVLYDVHEYYANYYSGKLPLPTLLRRQISRRLEQYQVRAAGLLGAANVVTELMSEPFRAAGVPVVVSPNYPAMEQFEGLPSVPFADRRWRVLHVGTLSADYGTELLLDIARRSAARGLPFDFRAIARFPSPDHERSFESLYEAVGKPENFRLIPTRPTHEMPKLFAEAGFNLSLLAKGGQNEASVPSKNYEGVMAGLVNVVSDRKAQRAFVERYGVSVCSEGDGADEILDQMMTLATRASETEAALVNKAMAARDHFTWERAVEPGLRNMYRHLRAAEATGDAIA